MIGFIIKKVFGITAYLVGPNDIGGRWSFLSSNAYLFTYNYYLEINTENKYDFIDKTDTIKYKP